MNKFSITGFVSNVTISTVGNTQVARFGISLNTERKAANGETTKQHAFMNFEALRKEANKADFDLIKKGANLTINGLFEAKEYDRKDGSHAKEVVLKAISWEEYKKEEQKTE